MIANHIERISQSLQIQYGQVERTLQLLDEGGTVPFISRYRKEVTGNLDEVAIAAIRDQILQLRELDKRRESILKSLKEREILTDSLKEKIENALTLTELEDIYLPYKPKRRTKATIAREKGLEPLAKSLFENKTKDIDSLAQQFIDVEKDVENVEQALQGARDIIAEWINEDQEARSEVREIFKKEGVFKARVIPGKEKEGQKYKDYFEWEEPIARAPSHRVLAMRRAEKEMIIMLDSTPDENAPLHRLENRFVKGPTVIANQLELAVKDSYKRLLKPSMETEIRMFSKKKADEEAINVFAENLKQLLLTAPLGQKNVLALDPGFRSGCKVVVLDKQGKLLENSAIYPHEPQKQTQRASATLLALCERFKVEAIAIGNGTAGRETESFVRSLGLPSTISVVMVNESGASIYSASDVAREEFPDHDLTVRGAVSIGRRLMDPLAELVKLDAKSIGVGQYQHDVDQNQLKHSLDDVVMSCVNAVGVEVNTASKELLTYVAGLGPQLAQNIINFRNENGPFASRKELKKVPRLGEKAFEQAAGFLKIRHAANPLDTSSVHPERYKVVEQMAKDLGSTVQDLMKDPSIRASIDLQRYLSESVGLPTLKDILSELEKPGIDPREKFEAFAFMEGVQEIEDLKVGMKLPGIVTNITNFGAFVDVGVHQDGLVHVSQISDSYCSNPAEKVQVQQQVMVTVTELDIARKRISLSMKSNPFEEKKTPKPRQKINKLSDRRNESRNNISDNQKIEGDLQSKLSQLKGKFKS